MRLAPFRMRGITAYHLAVQALCYGLAAALYPSIAALTVPRLYFTETYFGCIAASAALTVIGQVLRPGMLLGLSLFLRYYLFIIIGYSIGGYLSVKLVLGIGLMVELGARLRFPSNLGFSGLTLATLAYAQVRPAFFGPSSLADAPQPPGTDDLAVLCLVLGLAAAATAAIARLSERRDELAEAVRVQEANLDTLSELNLNLQGYARTVDEESAERERTRISREMHDISGYIFTNLIALMDAAGSIPRGDQSGLTDILVTARSQAQEGLRETRNALRKLRAEKPEAVDGARAIFKIVSIFRKIAGIEVELNLGNLPRYLARDLNLALYRTVQEALTNAVRHGKATRVRINFWVQGMELLLTITDNGKGAFDVVKGIGIAGMEERIGALGGVVIIGRAPEGGFSLSIQVPLQSVQEGGLQAVAAAGPSTGRAGPSAGH
jgi:signal transduction histidine kinase